MRIDDPLYIAALVSELCRAHPEWRWQRLAREIGISRDRLRRIRNYQYVPSLPLQLHVESMLDRSTVELVRRRFSQPKRPTFWASMLKESSHVTRHQQGHSGRQSGW